MDSENNIQLTNKNLLSTTHYPLLAIHNPFNAPVYHEDTVDSTMNVSRILAQRGEPHGTVIAADLQKAGRGRIKERFWDMEKGNSLAFTLLLRFPGIENIPCALTLRTGLAVSLAIEDFAPALAGTVKIKWPNDIIILNAANGKKAAGILTEADSGIVPPAVRVHIGIGVNVAQRQFPGLLQNKATSISIATGREIDSEERYALLEQILARLYAEIAADDNDWRSRIEERLYKKGEQARFIEGISWIPGAADSGKIINGILAGIGPQGELLIAPADRPETEPLSFVSGELVF